MCAELWSDGGAGFPSPFPPPDALPRGTGRNERGRGVTVRAVGRLFVQLTIDGPGLVGMGGDPPGDAAAVCKIASLRLPDDPDPRDAPVGTSPHLTGFSAWDSSDLRGG
jgi:hypothetical protein